MENLTILQIIVKDSPNTDNKNNKNLFKFLNLNYQEIIQSNYYIQLTLLTQENYKSIPSKIKNTPALINSLDQHIEIGTYNIINYLITLCEGSPYDETKENRDEGVNEEETKSSFNNISANTTDIRDFLLSEALADDTIEDPIDLNKVKEKENKYKTKQESQKKTNIQLKNNMMKTLKYNNQHGNNSIDNSIDNLPSDEKNMFNNAEITQTRPISDYMSDDKELQKFWENMDET